MRQVDADIKSHDHGPFDAAFGRDEMEALVAEAHTVDRPVLCHALGGEGLRVAVEAGADSIEHGCYLADEPELIARMADRGTFFVPTLTVYEFHRESQSPHVRERALALQRPHTESIQRALAAGVRVVAGTDAGGHEHGINAREIVLLEQAGLTIERHAFADHFSYRAKDLVFAGDFAIVMTEKDAVKCRSFELGDAWYLPVRTQFLDDGEEQIRKQLNAMLCSRQTPAGG
ncbi:MAG: tetraacyldisaccharide 4'-kinase [Proteobacteria bacterium]|nr:tetraacyldisaccharide 4'-kinase [Pseudomonadota bacterium]